MPRSSELRLKQRLSQRLRSFRQERRLKVEKLAVLLGVPDERIHEFESGQRLPPLLTLVRFAEELHVDLDALVSEEPDQAPLTNRLLRQRFREVASLPLQDQEAVSELLDTVVRSVRSLRGRKE